MSKRTALLLAPLAMLAVVPVSASARAAAKSHKVSLTGVIDTIAMTGPVGVAGSKETDAGMVKGTVGGKSAGNVAFYAFNTWGPGLTLTGTGTAFNTRGSLRARVSTKFTPGPGGTFSYTGTEKITGGTGSYKRASGTLTVSGTTLASDNDAATIKITGNLKY